MHAWFECIAWLDEHSGDPEESMLRMQAEKLTVPESAVNTLLPDFLKMLQVPAIRLALSKKRAGNAPLLVAYSDAVDSGQVHLRLERERTLVLLQDNQLVLGTIDRLVMVMENGRPVAADILDFKTDRLVGDRAFWIQSKQQHYGPQLAEYRSAVSHCFGIPASRISTRLLLLEAAVVVDSCGPEQGTRMYSKRSLLCGGIEHVHRTPFGFMGIDGPRTMPSFSPDSDQFSVNIGGRKTELVWESNPGHESCNPVRLGTPIAGRIWHLVVPRIRIAGIPDCVAVSSTSGLFVSISLG